MIGRFYIAAFELGQGAGLVGAYVGAVLWMLSLVFSPETRGKVLVSELSVA